MVEVEAELGKETTTESVGYYLIIINSVYGYCYRCPVTLRKVLKEKNFLKKVGVLSVLPARVRRGNQDIVMKQLTNRV